MTDDMFGAPAPAYQPLAARVRPRCLDDYIGQQHILGKGMPLRQALDQGQVHSMVLWGPPGTGKTTLARLLAELVEARFHTLSAVLSGVKDIRDAVAQARQQQAQDGGKTILFVDEVHRFNKAQQDAFLPHIEDGTIIFIGATTENPSFELNNALLSRCRVYLLRSLEPDAISRIVRNAVADPRAQLGQLELPDEVLQQLAQAADGDARRALNLLELLLDLARQSDGSYNIAAANLAEVLRSDSRRFDKGGDVFYEQISALHKAVRGSSPDAALYWYARMLDGGCDPLYIARRVVRMASEDIGNADPRALQLALNAWDAQTRLGSPEGELVIAQALVYLACAAKSNAVYQAYNAARAEAASSGSLPVPLHLRNAPTQLMQQMDYGSDYRYAHDEDNGYAAGENYFPPELAQRRYYHPVSRGLEQKIADKLAQLRQWDSASAQQRYGAGTEE